MVGNSVCFLDFEIQHRPGNKHTNADTMLRHMEISDIELQFGPCKKCHRRTQEMQGPLGSDQTEVLSLPEKIQAVKTPQRTAAEAVAWLR